MNNPSDFIVSEALTVVKAWLHQKQWWNLLCCGANKISPARWGLISAQLCQLGAENHGPNVLSCPHCVKRVKFLTAMLVPLLNSGVLFYLFEPQVLCIHFYAICLFCVSGWILLSTKYFHKVTVCSNPCFKSVNAGSKSCSHFTDVQRCQVLPGWLSPGQWEGLCVPPGRAGIDGAGSLLQLTCKIGLTV